MHPDATSLCGLLLNLISFELKAHLTGPRNIIRALLYVPRNCLIGSVNKLVLNG
jgi:hypothetical protein